MKKLKNGRKTKQNYLQVIYEQHFIEIEAKQTLKDDEIMVDRGIYRRKRIGYKEQYKRLKPLYVECNKLNTKAANIRIPTYYLLKHEYIISSVQMKNLII